MLTNAVVINAPMVESAMAVSRLAIIFGVIKPQQIVLTSFLAQVDTAVVNRQLYVLLITLVSMEGRALYVDLVP